ncbi:MAG: hypothetical protein KU29_13020 [Sulfurovum sp. FS06-10]|nr:MAG: hypothetical protein KU29_13020 [Sulfurovum sp. FS06-10]
MNFVCTTCYQQFDNPSSNRKGSLTLTWIIFFFLSMGIGVIYWLFVSGKKDKLCPCCGGSQFIPTSSVRGQQIINEATKTVQLNQPTIKSEEPYKMSLSTKLYGIFLVLFISFVIFSINA